MPGWPDRARDCRLPAGVFLAVVVFHFLWLGFFPETDPAQDSWIAPPAGSESAWISRYVESGGYWLGYSYALSVAFAATALRRYRRHRRCCDRSLAVGGLTFSGVLPVVGCYLVGCCGSPMLPVYLSLFGAAFLPWAKPLVAGLTTLMIGATWLWLARRTPPIGAPDAVPPSATADTPA